ncbi:MAG: riboflavin synthase [Candidatus Woesearchaeota archaeon]|nr:riboflavin synthase [Candidatus Woesearchaeota archaeon]
MKKIGIADTMFSRFDMGNLAISTIKDSGESIKTERYTVPGVKDLPVACKILFEDHGCDIVMALGMPGPKQIDKQCAHEATIGLMNVQLEKKKHIIEVFVHIDEAENERKLTEIVKDRTIKHARNAIALLKGKTELTRFAGQGIRQGGENAGPLVHIY